MTTFLPMSPELFGLWAKLARDISPLHAANITDGRDYSDATCYVSDDGVAGYAITADGELISVAAFERGYGDAIVASAVQNGATHLDCYAGHLSRLYARHGFKITSSEPNWTPGEPDVVYMSL